MRKRFDHLVQEITLAVGQEIPRYRLWLRLHEHGCDPEVLTARMAVAFCDGPLASFLAAEGLKIRWMARRRLREAVAYFDPMVHSPDSLASLPE